MVIHRRTNKLLLIHRRTNKHSAIHRRTNNRCPAAALSCEGRQKPLVRPLAPAHMCCSRRKSTRGIRGDPTHCPTHFPTLPNTVHGDPTRSQPVSRLRRLQWESWRQLSWGGKGEGWIHGRLWGDLATNTQVSRAKHAQFTANCTNAQVMSKQCSPSMLLLCS